MDFAQFESIQKADGHDEVLVREWAPDFSNDTHTHPFDTHVLVVRGEFWLSTQGKTIHFKAGDHFDLPRNQPHSERYGPEGATFWAARKN